MRIADFDCNVGDILVLQEWDPKTKNYTGRVLEKEVGYVGKVKSFDFFKKEEIEKYGLQCIALKQENISQELFDQEISLCRKMYKKKAGCAWGKCENCAVPLLLQKMYKGEIIEEKDKVQKFKNDILL